MVLVVPPCKNDECPNECEFGHSSGLYAGCRRIGRALEILLMASADHSLVHLAAERMREAIDVLNGVEE